MTWFDELNSMNAKYRWSQKGPKREIHWKCWIKQCDLKVNGGLGFKDLCIYLSNACYVGVEVDAAATLIILSRVQSKVFPQ